MLEPEDAQLLGRPGGRGQPEQVHGQPRIAGGLLSRPVHDRLGPPARVERGQGNQRQQQQDGVDQGQQGARQGDRHGQAQQRQNGVEPVLHLAQFLLEHCQTVGVFGALLADQLELPSRDEHAARIEASYLKPWPTRKSIIPCSWSAA